MYLAKMNFILISQFNFNSNFLFHYLHHFHLFVILGFLSYRS
jgi:hypothetical protein